MNDSSGDFNRSGTRVMNLSPLVDASLAIQLHVAAVVPAAFLGPVILFASKGTPPHRLLGRMWIGLMALSASSSFFIHKVDLFMGFSPIHLLSAYVLAGCWLAVRAARRRRIAEHKRHVVGMYLGGIVGAGAFTLMPGRIVHDMMFTLPDKFPAAVPLAIFAGFMAGALCLTLAIAVFVAPRRRCPERI